MPSDEIRLLENALGLSLTEVGLDWHQFQKDYGRHDESADRAFFTWQRFRGEHRANSYLLDDEGRLRGLIIKGTELEKIRLPELPALEYLCVCENKQLQEIELQGEAYPLLQYVDWSNNALRRLDVTSELPLLKYLSLRNNQINRFKIASPRQLLELEELDLSYNRIKNWDAFVLDKMPALKYLFLYNNRLNESVTTYREEGEDKNYLRSLQALRKSFGEEKPIKNDTYKILVVGDGKAGKSCMVERLVRNRFLDTWDSTHGISIERFKDTDKRYNFPYELNLWDFGGQDIYHHTHRMFLQANATYILLWNYETEYQDKIAQPIGNKKYDWENKKVPYWLDYIRYLGKGSPVVVAQTRSLPSNKRDSHPMESELREAYRKVLPYVSDFLHLDAEEKDSRRSGYKRLLQEVEQAIDSLDREEYLPAHWQPIRKQLEDMTPREAATDKNAFMGMERNTLELQEFLNMVPSKEPEPMKLLTNWLVPTGVVFYKEGFFDNKIILNQAWVIRAVYALYDRSEMGYYFELKENKGRFGGLTLNACWKDYTEAERSWFLEFMLKAELCFEITPEGRDASWEDREFVAVEMLPTERPGGLSIQERNWQSQGTSLCQLRYRYLFLHTGIIQSFIARTHRFADIEDIYKQGVVVIVEDYPVLIEAQPEEQGSSGDILVTLPTAGVAVLHRIRKEFEGIHKEREYEEAVRPFDGKWVSWEVLEEKFQDSHLSTIDKSTVPSEPYRLFLPHEKQRQVPALSESQNGSQDPLHPSDSKTVQIVKPTELELASVNSVKPKPDPVMPTFRRILFLAASPLDEARLQLDLEYNKIQKDLKLGRHHYLFQFLPPVLAATVQDLLRAMNNEPDIVHFAGHGTQEGILIASDSNEGRLLPTEALLRLFRPVKNSTKCVLLSSCYSSEQAKVISNLGILVIGYNAPVGDDSAIEFVRGFYNGLGEGKDFQAAYNDAMIAWSTNSTANVSANAWLDGEKLDW